MSDWDHFFDYEGIMEAMKSDCDRTLKNVQDARMLYENERPIAAASFLCQAINRLLLMLRVDYPEVPRETRLWSVAELAAIANGQIVPNPSLEARPKGERTAVPIEAGIAKVMLKAKNWTKSTNGSVTSFRFDDGSELYRCQGPRGEFWLQIGAK